MTTRVSPTRHAPRKTPKQKRSEDTVEIILEASARILEGVGLDGFTTNAVAERAGISVGSVYQYFPSKHAILAELARRHRVRFVDLTRTAIESCRNEPIHALIGRLVDAAVAEQFRRPALARMLDIAERDPSIDGAGAAHLRAVLDMIAEALAARGLRDPVRAAEDLMALTRALTDAAGGRQETRGAEVAAQIKSAALGYLADRAG
ncbi:MAG: TetR/AcrR family transcriptional regulator [Azospirillum sp.]|nr:TetR/AcrR family transcriptional regulator [Azospirillum sp.]